MSQTIEIGVHLNDQASPGLKVLRDTVEEVKVAGQAAVSAVSGAPATPAPPTAPDVKAPPGAPLESTQPAAPAAQAPQEKGGDQSLLPAEAGKDSGPQLREIVECLSRQLSDAAAREAAQGQVIKELIESATKLAQGTAASDRRLEDGVKRFSDSVARTMLEHAKRIRDIEDRFNRLDKMMDAAAGNSPPY